MKENSIDRVLIFGGITAVSIEKWFKWIFSNEGLTKITLILTALLLLLRAVDWCIRRYRYGWKPNENTETFTKE